MKILIVLLFISIAILADMDFNKSKKILLKQIYHDNRVTFYCEVPYKFEVIKGKETVVLYPQGKYTPRNAFTKSGKPNERTTRLEWEHIMPAENFGRHLPCWQEGGRKACSKDPLFNKMEADMHNLVPSIGEVNGDRSNYRFATDLPKKGMYGECEFEVNFKDKRAYPKLDIRGDIARAYLYMSETYNINLSKQERQLMEAWHKQDPVSDWERLKNDRVKKIQGNSNKFAEQ